MQTSRRTSPYPYTWEIPAAVVTTVLLTLALGAQVGRALANLVAGAGWVWPPPGEVVTSVVGLLAGDATAGLAVAPGAVAGPVAVRAWVGVVESVVIAGLVWAAVWMWPRWGPGRVRGMASWAEAGALLGRRRLMRSAPVIRPDLYPDRTRRSGPRGESSPSAGGWVARFRRVGHGSSAGAR